MDYNVPDALHRMALATQHFITSGDHVNDVETKTTSKLPGEGCAMWK